MCLSKITGVALCGVVLLDVGCHGKKEPDAATFKSAISSYYTAHPQCVWSSPVKLPVQVDASKDQQTSQFDALTDAGLLTRKAEEKKRFLIGSKQVTDYDLSDKGRSAWTADQTQPGYGNFCYGRREATSIDGFTIGTSQSGGAATASVTYHYDIAGAPDWAKSEEMKTAFSNLQADLSGQQVDKATLVQTPDGWQVSKE